MGKGEGGDKRGQAEAGRDRAEGVAAGAEGQGEGQGQRAAEGPRADPFNVADARAGMDMRRREWRSRRESVVADILEVSEDEGEGAGRMALEGGPGQPSAPNVPAAAMKSILLEVRRQEEGKGGRGQLEAGAAGSGDSSVSAGGRGRTGKGGKGQAGTSGAVPAKGHLAGKGGKGSGQGRQWPQPQRLFRQLPPRLPPRVSAAVRAEEEREVRRQQAARYEALAHVEHQRRRRHRPEQGPDTIYQLEMKPGRTGMRGEQAEQSGAAMQGSGAGQVEGGKGRQGKGARQQGLQGRGQGRAGLHGVGGMRWYRHKGMDLPEEYMRCHCGQGQETYEHSMRCEQYKGIEEPLVRDQEVPLLKKSARGRSAVERELGKEGDRKGLCHMVIVKPLWRALEEHTVAPEAMAHRPLRRMVEHLQKRMACRETQLEARAEDMRDAVIKRVEMALIRYNPKITEMKVRRRPDWRPRRSGGETGMEDRKGEEQREI